jgi:hypothetical protein
VETTAPITADAGPTEKGPAAVVRATGQTVTLATGVADADAAAAVRSLLLVVSLSLYVNVPAPAAVMDVHAAQVDIHTNVLAAGTVKIVVVPAVFRSMPLLKTKNGTPLGTVEAVPVVHSAFPISETSMPVGVTSAGLVAKTHAPVPVSSVMAAIRFALEGVARKVPTLAAGVIPAHVSRSGSAGCAGEIMSDIGFLFVLNVEPAISRADRFCGACR